MDNQGLLIKGRGSQINPSNKFDSSSYVSEYIEGIDENWELFGKKTKYYVSNSKSLVNKVNSPDVKYNLSINPYQGCEHGCVYCYARESHQYWGFGPGLDFESKIIVKPNAPELLEKYFRRRSYIAQPIMLSGNTDCYQPIERKLKITRRLLEVFLKYRNPVSIISKNYTMLRDLDLLKKLAEKNLVHVAISLTSLDKDLQQKMEPRTASPFKRLKTIKELSENGIPVQAMIAPVIPALTDHEIPALLQAAAAVGAESASYIVVRLNGNVSKVFENWVQIAYPSRSKRILSAISKCHNGNLNDSRFNTRMTGDGQLADAIKDLFEISRRKHFKNDIKRELDSSQFRVPGISKQSTLF
ncbi:MAG: PA0069 family radical SAM protein [Chitinophagales bacterium]|nr:PA0069 family radical SAM protein [Chitinophagales bacterium]